MVYVRGCLKPLFVCIIEIGEIKQTSPGQVSLGQPMYIQMFNLTLSEMQASNIYFQNSCGRLGRRQINIITSEQSRRWCWQKDRVSTRGRIPPIVWQRRGSVFVCQLHYFVKLATLMLGTKVRVDAKLLYPVHGNDSHISSAHEILAEHVNAVVNMFPECWLNSSGLFSDRS